MPRSVSLSNHISIAQGAVEFVSCVDVHHVTKSKWEPGGRVADRFDAWCGSVTAQPFGGTVRHRSK